MAYFIVNVTDAFPQGYLVAGGVYDETEREEATEAVGRVNYTAGLDNKSDYRLVESVVGVAIDGQCEKSLSPLQKALVALSLTAAERDNAEASLRGYSSILCDIRDALDLGELNPIRKSRSLDALLFVEKADYLHSAMMENVNRFNPAMFVAMLDCVPPLAASWDAMNDSGLLRDAFYETAAHCAIDIMAGIGVQSPAIGVRQAFANLAGGTGDIRVELGNIANCVVALASKTGEMENGYFEATLTVNRLMAELQDAKAWKDEAKAANRARVEACDGQATTIDQLNAVQGQLDRLMTELGGLTLGQLPNGALASMYCDIKAGR